MSDPNQEIFDQLFGEQSSDVLPINTQTPQSVPTVVQPVQTTQTPSIDFNLFGNTEQVKAPVILQPSPQVLAEYNKQIESIKQEETKLDLPWETEDEDEEDDTTLMPGEEEPNNTFSFDGIPGFDETPPQSYVDKQSNDILSIFAGGGSETVIPPTKRPRGRPKTVQTPETVANAMPAFLTTEQEQHKSHLGIEESITTSQQNTNQVVLSFDAEKVLAIGQGLQTIGRAVEAIALARLQKS